MSRKKLTKAVLAAAAGVALAAPTCLGAEPRIELRLPAFSGNGYPNFAALAVPAVGHGALELWVQDALAEIRTATLRVRLNEVPLTPFVTINPLPRGVRAIVRLGTSVNPDYLLRPGGENILSFSVEDATGVKYQGQFYLTAQPDLPAPRVLPARAGAPAKAVEAPAMPLPPVVEIRSRWPERTSESILTLEAEVTDVEGLKRIAVEVNGRDTDEIVLENEWPVRKHDGFMSSRKLPGEVEGDAHRVRFSIPVRLGKDITVVAVRAENTGGLRARADRTVVRLKD
ncbi:MAG: hypothetical protein U0599_13725 [Vicinamibacteria bacterium]